MNHAGQCNQAQQPIPYEMTASGGLQRIVVNLSYLIEGMTGVNSTTVERLVTALQKMAFLAVVAVQKTAARSVLSSAWQEDDEADSEADEEDEPGRSSAPGNPVTQRRDGALQRAWVEASTRSSAGIQEGLAPLPAQRRGGSSGPGGSSLRVRHWVLSLAVYMLLHRIARTILELRAGQRSFAGLLRRLLSGAASGGRARPRLDSGFSAIGGVAT
jgi:hypothetical protein